MSRLLVANFTGKSSVIKFPKTFNLINAHTFRPILIVIGLKIN